MTCIKKSIVNTISTAGVSAVAAALAPRAKVGCGRRRFRARPGRTEERAAERQRDPARPRLRPGGHHGHGRGRRCRPGARPGLARLQRTRRPGASSAGTWPRPQPRSCPRRGEPVPPAPAEGLNQPEPAAPTDESQVGSQHRPTQGDTELLKRSISGRYQASSYSGRRQPTGGISFASRGSAASDRGTLAAGACFAAELDIAHGIRASLADRDDVVELKPLAGTVVEASSLVAVPNLLAYPFRLALPERLLELPSVVSRVRNRFRGWLA
jgi:hypothetical protein